VFALGCLFYQCATAQMAFAGSSVKAMHVKILFGQPPSLLDLAPEAPRALEDLVRRMLAKDPDDRPADGNAVAAELAAIEPIPKGPRRRAGMPDLPTKTVVPRKVQVPQGATDGLQTALIFVGSDEIQGTDEVTESEAEAEQALAERER